MIKICKYKCDTPKQMKNIIIIVRWVGGRGMRVEGESHQKPGGLSKS